MENREVNILYQVEELLHQRGIELVCGMDEAGRGPLAGPVVAAAVILPRGLILHGLNDSKKLTEKKRDVLYEIITEHAIAWAVGLADEREIDDVNILQATFLAMKRAADNLSVKPQAVLVDGNQNPSLGISSQTIVKGDSKVACIAAASILAKVTRDRMLIELDEKYPQYGFKSHKGYPTKRHYKAIEQYGVIAEHRLSFLKNLQNRNDSNER